VLPIRTARGVDPLEFHLHHCRTLMPQKAAAFFAESRAAPASRISSTFTFTSIAILL